MLYGAESEFYREVRLGVARRIIIIQEHERIDGAEFRLLADDDALLDEIEAAVLDIRADAVVNERLISFGVCAIPRIFHLFVRLFPNFRGGVRYVSARGR